jgi:hypothetical protein
MSVSRHHRFLERLIPALAVCVFLPAIFATSAQAASYRRADVQKAVQTAFKGEHGGGPATANCTSSGSDTRWRCRLSRASTKPSSRFTLTVRARGRWSTSSFSFPGFSAKHTLSACCLRRR